MIWMYGIVLFTTLYSRCSNLCVPLSHFSKYIVLNKREYNNYAFQFVIEAPSTAEELTTKFDIAFVLDDSGSISSSDFTKMRDECKQLSDRFTEMIDWLYSCLRLLYQN